MKNSNPLDVDKEQTVSKEMGNFKATKSSHYHLQASELVLEGITDDDYVKSPANRKFKNEKYRQDKDRKIRRKKQKQLLKKTDQQTKTNSKRKTDTDSENQDSERRKCHPLLPDIPRGTTFLKDILDDVDQFNDMKLT